jgi:hypothetical protein
VYVQPWYGQRNCFAQPSASVITSAAWWRHTLKNARKRRSLPRTTTTGSPATSHVTNRPGSFN